MKFLILTQYFFPEVGASQIRLAALVRELTRSGHEVEVITAFPNYPRGSIFPEYRGRMYMREEWHGIRVHRTWLYASMGAGLKRMLNYGSFTATSLLAVTKVNRPDWVFVESPPPTLAITGLFMARSLGAPLVANIADLWPDSIRALHLIENNTFLSLAEQLARFVYRRADCLSAVTDGIRRTLIDVKGVPEDKVTFLPNAADTEACKPLPPDEALRTALGLQGKVIVLYGGTHGYAHALEHALHAALRLSAERDIHFLFIGDGSEKARLVQMATELRLSNVTFLDPVPASEIPRYMSIACCGLVPQRNVALFDGNRPAKLFTVMCASKPVVFAGKGEGASLVKEAGAGLVVQPENAEALSEAIRTLANDCGLRARMGACGRSYIERHLTWPIVVRDWLGQMAGRNTSPRTAAA